MSFYRKYKKTLLTIFFVLLVFVFSAPFFSLFAADGRCGPTDTTLEPLKFNFNVPLPGFNDNNGSIDIDCLTLADYIKYIYKFTIGVTGLLAVFMITIGGIYWVFSGGNSGKISQAKQYINGAISGLLLAIGSYSILYIINPQLVEVRPVKIPLVKKAVLPVCTDSGLKESSDKKVFISVKDANNKTSGQNTWCGMQYKVEGSESEATCWGLACEMNGNVKKICSPFVSGVSAESINIGVYEKYRCIDGIEVAKKNLIRGCNAITDSVDGNTKAQAETQSACDDVNKQTVNFPKGTFKEGEGCYWMDYSWYGNTDTDGCRWCPSSYYEVIKNKMINGQCNLFKRDGDQTNGLCKVEEGCYEPGIDTDNHGGDDHEYAVDACAKILYPKHCSGK